jgi:hypothetical protein
MASEVGVVLGSEGYMQTDLNRLILDRCRDDLQCLKQTGLRRPYSLDDCRDALLMPSVQQHHQCDFKQGEAGTAKQSRIL